MTGTQVPSRRHLITLAVPTTVALAFFLPILLGGDPTFLSDDYMLALFHDAATGSVDWSMVGQSLSEPWYGSTAYWRPMVSLSYGLNIALFGFSPLSMYAVNLALHLVVVAATAHICYRFCSQEHPVMAGILGGSICAVHPFACEPVLWIAARTTGLELCFRMCALAAFAAYLRSGRRSTYAAVAACSALALASQESAVVLPFLFVGLDLLDSPRRRARDRFVLHAPLCGLWLAYFALRIAIFGALIGSPAPDPGFTELVASIGGKIGNLFAPNTLAAIGWLIALGCTAFLARGRSRRVLTFALLCTVALVLTLGPTYKTHLGNGMVGVRLFYGSLPVLAVLASRCLLSARRATIGWIGGLGGLALVVLGLPAAYGYAGCYSESWRQMRIAQADLMLAGQGARPEKPLAVISVPPCATVPGPVNPLSYFAFGRRPFVEDPYPVTGLGCLIHPLPVSAGLLHDPRPVHALLESGCPTVFWSEAVGRMQALDIGPRGAQPRPGLVKDLASGSVRFDPARPVFGMQQVLVRTTADCEGGRIAWRTSLGDFGFDPPFGISFSGGKRENGEKTFFIDVSRHAPLLQLALASAKVTGCAVELRGGRLLGLRVSDRLPEIDLATRFQGATIVEIEDALVAPATTGKAPLHLVLLGAPTAFKWTVQPGAEVRPPASVDRWLRILVDRLHRLRFHYYFAAEAPQGQPGSARSALDWFVFAPPTTR